MWSPKVGRETGHAMEGGFLAKSVKWHIRPPDHVVRAGQPDNPFWRATHPCLCGNLTDPSKECTCTAQQVQKYMSKISGPLLDRIDLHIEVPAVKYKELQAKRAERVQRRFVHV